MIIISTVTDIIPLRPYGILLKLYFFMVIFEDMIKNEVANYQKTIVNALKMMPLA
tara:strand:- start:2017 stop:2181 length:165 start_codon:yes stop_codon:yes gene_type:complete